MKDFVAALEDAKALVRPLQKYCDKFEAKLLPDVFNLSTKVMVFMKKLDPELIMANTVRVVRGRAEIHDMVDNATAKDVCAALVRDAQDLAPLFANEAAHTPATAAGAGHGPGLRV